MIKPLIWPIIENLWLWWAKGQVCIPTRTPKFGYSWHNGDPNLYLKHEMTLVFLGAHVTCGYKIFPSPFTNSNISSIAPSFVCKFLFVSWVTFAKLSPIHNRDFFHTLSHPYVISTSHHLIYTWLRFHMISSMVICPLPLIFIHKSINKYIVCLDALFKLMKAYLLHLTIWVNINMCFVLVPYFFHKFYLWCFFVHFTSQHALNMYVTVCGCVFCCI